MHACRFHHAHLSLLLCSSENVYAIDFPAISREIAVWLILAMGARRMHGDDQILDEGRQSPKPPLAEDAHDSD